MVEKDNVKAFTIVELMVSIFLTLIVVASFYKVYNMASRDERSSAIRISVNVAGEQMLDAISNAIRFIGLNSKPSDWESYDSGTISSGMPLIETAQLKYFSFLSPYGGPVTKLAKDAEGTYPNCTFTLISSAAVSEDIKSFFLHNQDGIFETAKSEEFVVNVDGDGLSFTTDSGFQSAPRYDLDGTECGVVFPSGTLVSGQDNLFSLRYEDSDYELKLCAVDKDAGNDCTTTDDGNARWFVKFNSADKRYTMPRFYIQYLTETTSADGLKVEWKKSASGSGKDDFRKDIIAVRFGFILVSKNKRYDGVYDVDKFRKQYCIFGDERDNFNDTTDCYSLEDPNETAYVFRRVVYIANHRLLKDFNN